MMLAITGVVIAVVTLVAEIGFICVGNGLGAALCLVFGLMASGIFRFLAELYAEMKGGE
jgi:hypothetical protein